MYLLYHKTKFFLNFILFCFYIHCFRNVIARTSFKKWNRTRVFVLKGLCPTIRRIENKIIYESNNAQLYPCTLGNTGCPFGLN